MSNLIGAKLKHLIARSSLTPSQFALDFAKASGVRKAVIDEWLADQRNVYGKNLEKLATFWRTFFPSITASHLLMPQEDFVRLLTAPSGGQAQAGIVLPIQTNPLSGAQLSALTGSYRLYRYALTSRPTIVCETVSISADSNAATTLGVELRSPLAKGVQKFLGTVIAMGDRTYLLLSDVDSSSSAMRFITLHGRFEKKMGHLVGIMSGAFDRDDTISSVTVALEKESGDPARAREETSWLSLDALESVSKEIIFDLSMTKLTGTS